MKIKKMISGAVALSMAFLMGANSIEAIKFPDLKGYGWAEPSINDLTNKGIINGLPDGTYRPASAITRLESLILVSKLSPEEEITRLYTKNIGKYDARLNKYGIEDWAKPTIVYSLEKNGIIPNNDKMLKSIINQEQLKNNKKIQLNAKRYEFCVFLVRGLGMEGDINKNAKLSYKDAKQITPQAVPYIELLQRKGVLSKEGDGTGYFHPENSITRAEAAVIISKAYKYSEKAKLESQKLNSNNQTNQNTTKPAQEDNSRKIIKGKVNLLTYADDKLTIAVATEDGSVKSFTNFKNEISVKIGDKITSVNAIKIGQQASFDVEGYKLNQVFLEAEEENYSGTLTGYSTDSKTISVDIKNGDIKENKQFKYNDDTRIYVNDKLTDISQLPKDNEIDFTVQDGVIIKGAITVTKEKIDGEVVNYTDDSITINSSRKGEVTKTFDRAMKVYRNDKKVEDVNSIAIGDMATINLDNDKVVEIDVTAKRQKFLSAIIKEIQMNSKFNKIIIEDTNKKNHNLTVDEQTVIRIYGKKANIYDLKIGLKVDVYTQGGLVEEIISDGGYKTKSVSGVVIATDTVDRMIEVKQDNGQILKVYYNIDTKADKLKNGLKIDPKDIQRDDEITVIGIEESGRIKADRIIANI